jgi:SAM-dependent methyltransferase
VRTISTTPARTTAQALPLTGERTAPGIWHETYWYARHLAAYRAAVELCRDRLVLDAGSGEGYGCAAVAGVARAVVGIDYDPAATSHAALRYAGRASFARANLVALPLAEGAVDVVLSLQVVEHIWTPEDLIAQAARALRPGGALVLSTPNRRTFSPGLGRDERPLNPFHSKEYDAAELAALVGRHLEVTSVGGIHAGPRLQALDARFGSFRRAQLSSEPASWPAPLASAVRSVRSADFVVRTDDPDGALDLLVVARRGYGPVS